MSDKKDKKKIKVSLHSLLSRFRTIIKFLLITISSKTMHWMVIILIFLISAWLLYVNIWLPLNQNQGLPQNISPHNPEIQNEMLQELHIQRSQRVQHVNRTFLNAVNYFNGE